MALAAPKSSRQFWKVWSAATSSNLADGIRSAALPLLAASITRDPLAVASVAVAQQLPWLVFGLVGGVVADRVPVRKLIWVTNAARALLLVALAAAIVSGAVTIGWVLTVAFALGCAEALVDSAYPGMVVAVVESERLEWANARLVASSVAGNELVGPALGGLLFTVGIAVPVAVDGGLLAAAALFVLGLPTLVAPPPPQSRVPDTIPGQIVAGVRWLARHRAIRSITLAGGVLMLLDTAWYAVLVLFVLEELGFSQAGFGALLAVGAIGGLVGSVVGERLARTVTGRMRLVGSLAIAGVTQMVVGVSDQVGVVASMLALSSAAFATWNITAATIRQRETPRDLLGRVSAAYTTLLVVAGAAGAGLGGVLASTISLRAPMLIGGPVLLITALWLGGALSHQDWPVS